LRESNVLNPSYPGNPWFSFLIAPAVARFVVKKSAFRHGATRISGILGMDTLYICRAIIDLDGMNLFLK